jgi:putative Mn2+ efflux pump MntP
VSEFVEEMGGEYNAFTSKEYTGYYVKVASKYLNKSIEFLSDILTESLFDSKELEKEKNVILQELDMYEDMPMEAVGNHFERALFTGNSLGRDIIGYKRTILETTRNNLKEYIGKSYLSNNCTVVIAGNIGDLNLEDVTQLVKDKFNFPTGNLPKYQQFNSKNARQLNIVNKKTEQSHLVIGYPGASYQNDERFALKLLAIILGGVASSRMFAEIREKRGLAYSVRSTTGTYLDTGSLETYAGVPHEKVLETMSAILNELITLLLMAFALGMDAFSVGLGMGMYRLRLRQIFKIGVTIGIFHVWMPLIGMVAGKFLSDRFGMLATYLGGMLLILLGVQMILSSIKKDQKSVITPVGWGLIVFALSVSLDSLSVGLTLGIYGAKTMLVVLCFGIVATILTWSGLLIGRKVQGLLGVYSVALGGSILLAFGLKLLLPI